MSFVFKLPDVGEGMAEGEIVKWFVKEGDSINEGEPLLELQNDKLLQEIPSPVTGVVKKVLVEPGTVSQVGDPLIEFAGDDASAEAAAPEAVAPAAQPEAAATSAAAGFVFNLPDVGEGMAEGEIVKWFVKAGDKIEEGQPLMELQNDKLLQEIPSPVTGVVKKILVEAGTVSTVGTPLIEFEGAAGSAPAPVAASAPAAQENVAVKTAPVRDNGNVLAMPSVRRYAKMNNVSLSDVTPTGNRGHVRKEDIDNFLKNGATTVAATVETTAPAAQATKKVEKAEAKPVVTSGDVTREKLTPMRKAIAKAMTTSKSTAPHVTLFDEVEVSALVAHRKKYKDIAAEQGIKLTYLPYIVKALTASLKKFPVLNASLDDTTDELVYKNYFNIGIAVDTPAGLFVPNIKNADTKGIYTIAKEITELAEKAHARTLSGAEMKDGTITISNIGSARGSWFTPIINYPEVAILGIGSILKKPIVAADGSIAVGQMLAVSLSFDHRVIDGASAQKFVNELKRLLNNPELLLMEG